MHRILQPSYRRGPDPDASTSCVIDDEGKLLSRPPGLVRVEDSGLPSLAAMLYSSPLFWPIVSMSTSLSCPLLSFPPPVGDEARRHTEVVIWAGRDQDSSWDLCRGASIHRKQRSRRSLRRNGSPTRRGPCRDPARGWSAAILGRRDMCYPAWRWLDRKLRRCSGCTVVGCTTCDDLHSCISGGGPALCIAITKVRIPGCCLGREPVTCRAIGSGESGCGCGRRLKVMDGVVLSTIHASTFAGTRHT